MTIEEIKVGHIYKRVLTPSKIRRYILVSQIEDLGNKLLIKYNNYIEIHNNVTIAEVIGLGASFTVSKENLSLEISKVDDYFDSNIDTLINRCDAFFTAAIKHSSQPFHKAIKNMIRIYIKTKLQGLI